MVYQPEQSREQQRLADITPQVFSSHQVATNKHF
jgi:hypothetical protein